MRAHTPLWQSSLKLLSISILFLCYQRGRVTYLSTSTRHVSKLETQSTCCSSSLNPLLENRTQMENLASQRSLVQQTGNCQRCVNTLASGFSDCFWCGVCSLSGLRGQLETFLSSSRGHFYTLSLRKQASITPLLCAFVCFSHAATACMLLARGNLLVRFESLLTYHHPIWPHLHNGSAGSIEDQLEEEDRVKQTTLDRNDKEIGEEGRER